MKRLLLRSAILGLACGLAAYLVGELGWLSGLDARAYDLCLRNRPPHSDPLQVVVIEIDDASISSFGRWPWPWSRHARFVRTLSEHYRPSAIVFDLLFAEPDRSDEEKEFARAVAEAGNVYLAAFFTDRSESDSTGRLTEVPWVVADYGKQSTWPGKHFLGIRSPVEELAAAAAGVGPVNVFPELDGCIRCMPLVLDYEGRPYLSLTGVVLNSWLNPEREPVSVQLGAAVDFGGRSVPIDRSGEIRISYAASSRGGGRRAFNHYPYHRVAARDVPIDALRDKTVLVGFGATGMADIHPTPLSSGVLGVDINAAALSGLLRGSFLRMAEWPARLTLAFLVGLVASLVAAAWSPGRALGVAAVFPVLVLALAAAALWWKGLWLGAAVPGLAALAGYTVMVALRHRESERESIRVSASVDTLAQATRVIGSVSQRRDLLTQIRTQISDAMGARQTNLYLLDEQGERLRLSLPPQTERGPLSYGIGEGTVGWVARHALVHLVHKVTPGSELEPELARSTLFPANSVAYAPMAHRGKVIGVVEVVRGVEDPPFEQRHLAVLEALASEAAVALENVGLYEKLEGRVEIANRRLLAAYQELKQERDRISAIVSNMADGVMLTDARQRVVFINPAAAAMFGVDAEEIEGKPVAEALPYPTLLEQLEAGPPKMDSHIPRIRLDEPRRLVLSPRTVRLTQEDGKPTGAITVVSDITLLEELSEMKTEFVSLVSHELRTPLTSIMGFAQTLQGDVTSTPPEEQREFLGIIEQESNRLLVMINDLLDISRMEAGRPLPVSYTQVDLQQLAEHVVRFQAVTTTAHRFLFEFREGRLVVEADRDKLEQVLTNLVSNATKYSPRGGDVVVGCYRKGDDVVVYVRDQGLGMGPDEIAQLFERYQRIDRDAIKGIRGTGLGLYLVRALVEAHRGSVWVESEPGKGSTFNFSLPARQPEPETAV